MKNVIYVIVCLENGKRYVGSATNFERRRRCHIRELATGSHGNSKLQRAWNKYGEKAFQFLILEQDLPLRDLLSTEQRHIDAEHPEFNICKNVWAPMLGRRRSAAFKKLMRERHVSSETRAKLRAQLVGNQRALGCKRSEETKAKMRLAMMRRLAAGENPGKLRRAGFRATPWQRRQLVEQGAVPAKDGGA